MESGKGVAILSRSELLCVLVTRRAAFSFLRFIALYLHFDRMAAAYDRPSVALSQECFARAAEWIEYWQYRLTQKAERLKIGSAWARTVQIEGGKVVPNDLLFTKWNGTPLDPNRVTSWFPHFLAAHDLPAVHFHSLRHSNASLLIAAHVPITAVSGRLGHAQTSTTLNIYASMIQSADAAAADALEGVFDRIQEKNHA